MNDGLTEDGNESAEWLAGEIEKEKRMSLILEQTMTTLNGTTRDLQRQLDDLERTEREWRESYEYQAEKNRDLKGSIDAMKANLRSMRARKSTNTRAVNVAANELSSLSQADLNILNRKLEKEKVGVERQVRDIEWRLDQESKAYSKALESKKKCITELNQTSQTLRSFQKMHHGLVPRPKQGGRF